MIGCIHGDAVPARAGQASPRAGARLGHPASIAIATVAVWTFNIIVWWIV